MFNVNNQDSKALILEKLQELKSYQTPKEISETETDNTNVFSSDNKSFNTIKSHGSAATILSLNPEKSENTENENSAVQDLLDQIQKPEITQEEIQAFISKINDETIDSILKAFDQMLINARKMMEENKIFYEKHQVPKIMQRQEALKKELIQKEIYQEEIQKK